MLFVIIYDIINHHLVATGYASNIDDNSNGLKSLPVKNMDHEMSNTSSNTCVKGLVITIRYT